MNKHRYFVRELGTLSIPVLDCDLIAKEVFLPDVPDASFIDPTVFQVVEPGTAGLKQLIKHFGDEILQQARIPQYNFGTVRVHLTLF